jgi:hypothetical protein
MIVPGLGSIREDYTQFAEFLAAQGFVVYSPNCNDSVKGTSNKDALGQRVEVVQRTIETLDLPLHATPHSLGAPVTAKALSAGSDDGLNRLVEYMKSINFMEPAGFENHGPDDFIHAWRFFTGEAAIRTLKLIPVMFKGGKASRERFNFSKRRGEVRGLWSLDENYMPTAIEDLDEKNIPMRFYVGPKDDLTRAKIIRAAVASIIGDFNVVDIHPQAGHIAAVTHPEHMVKLILDGIGVEYLDFNSSKVA